MIVLSAVGAVACWWAYFTQRDHDDLWQLPFFLFLALFVLASLMWAIIGFTPILWNALRAA